MEITRILDVSAGYDNSHPCFPLNLPNQRQRRVSGRSRRLACNAAATDDGLAHVMYACILQCPKGVTNDTLLLLCNIYLR